MAPFTFKERLNITPEKCLKLFQNHIRELRDDSKKKPTTLPGMVITLLLERKNDNFITGLKEAFSGWLNEEQDDVMSYFIKKCLEKLRNRCAIATSTHGL